MHAPSFADFPAAAKDALASLGYRLARWQAAREVLAHRLAKKRLPDTLQCFLERWIPSLETPVENLEACLEGDKNDFWLVEGGLASFAAERALLHLPALRMFWRQELRQAHWDALRKTVPQAWFADEQIIPPGAVIAGLDVRSWDQAQEIVRRKNLFLRVKKSSWAAKAVFYRDPKGQIALREWKAMP
ncbi:MAG: hypothetical protein ACKO8Z_10070 [Prosthecobacter sp.]